MKKGPHVIWVCPNSKSFYRSKGEVRCRPGSVIPKLAKQGIRINILIPHDPTLLPKTKLSPSRVVRHTIHLSQDYPVEIVKLTRGSVSPGIYMAKVPRLEAPLHSAVFSKAAIALARQLNRPVDILHVFNWEASLVPLFLELEKTNSRVFSETRTFLNVQSLRDQGNFAPAILNYLGIPKELFHPDGIEFYGKVSFLKSGLLFSDGVGVIEESTSSRSTHHRNGTGLEGILDKLMFKLRRWASDRSLRSHMDAYAELLALKKAKSLLPHMMKKLHASEDEAKQFIESWGPLPPERYGVNALSFVMQSPSKAFAFWEWAQSGPIEYGLALEDIQAGRRHLLSRGLSNRGDYWIDVEPDHTYVVELVGWSASGLMRPLLRSKPLHISRVSPAPNKEAVFIDVKSRRKYTLSAGNEWEELAKRVGSGGTSAWEWAFSSLPRPFVLEKTK